MGSGTRKQVNRLNLDRALSLRYHSQGSGPVLLLFNGATLPLEFWDPVADTLAQSYQIVRFDQRNAGESVFNGTFTLNDTAADAAAVLDHLDIDTAIVVGHAWGGRAAQVFARDYPHQTRALAICGTGGQLPATVDTENLKRQRQAATSGDRSVWEHALEENFCARGFRDRSPDSFQRLSDLLWDRQPRGKASWNSGVSPSSSYWGKCPKPALLIYGEEDRNGTPENAQHLQQMLPDSRLEFIEQAAHFVIQERPELVSQLLGEFAAGN